MEYYEHEHQSEHYYESSECVERGQRRAENEKSREDGLEFEETVVTYKGPFPFFIFFPVFFIFYLLIKNLMNLKYCFLKQMSVIQFKRKHSQNG